MVLVAKINLLLFSTRISTAVLVISFEFLQVHYECLSDEIKIGDYYLRLLLEEDDQDDSSAIRRR